jgi:glucose dehydrogenase
MVHYLDLAQADLAANSSGSEGPDLQAAHDAAPVPARLATVSGTPGKTSQAGQDWPAYGGSKLATRYSPLDQITSQNVSRLEKVWTYRTGDKPSEQAKGKYSPENTPLKIGEHLFVCSAKNITISVNAASGKEEWRYDPKVSDVAIPYGATCRGVAYYEEPNARPDQACSARILEGTLDARLIAVDAKSGQPCPDFGKHGTVDLKEGIGYTVPGWYSVTSPPTIVRGIAVVGAQAKDGRAADAPSGVIRGYDAVTGKLAWALTEKDMWGMSPIDQLWCRIQFKRAEYDGEYTDPTVNRPYIQYPGYNGGSDWGSVAVDTKRGILVANYNDMPNFDWLIPRAKADKLGYRPISEGGSDKAVADKGDPQAGLPYAIRVNAGWQLPTGLLCKQPPYGHIRAIDLKTGKTLWDHASAALERTVHLASRRCCR